MENQNVNQVNTQGSNLSDVKNLFSDYRRKQTESTSKKSREDILAKYFVPRKTKELFRILPPKNNRKHIEEAFFHVSTTNAAGGKKRHGTIIYCPAHNDPKVKKMDGDKPVLDQNGNFVMIPAPCPLCAKHKTLVATQNPTLKGIKKENMNDEQKIIKAKNDEIYKEAVKWEAKKFYIVRGIDKGAEKDGVKFWRFKHNYKNQGTLDKLLPVLEEFMTAQQTDFSDASNGTDLSISTTDSEFNGHIYKTISAITARGKSPLHADPIVMKQWLDDDISWRKVFVPKKAPHTTPLEFLEMVVNGVSPYWEDTDANNKHWVFPNNPELQLKANTRNLNLDADADENFEQASDLTDVEYANEPIQPVRNAPVEKKEIVNTPTFTKENVNATTLIGSSIETETTETNNQESNVVQPTSGEYDDLPF